MIQSSGEAKVYVKGYVSVDQNLRVAVASDRALPGYAAPIGDEDSYILIGRSLEAGKGLIRVTINIVQSAGTGVQNVPAGGTTGQVLTKDSATDYDVSWQTPSPPGTGTVTSVSAGDGMDFTTITASGSVAMGTPSTITATSLNGFSGTHHSHELDLSTLGFDVTVDGSAASPNTIALGGALDFHTNSPTYITIQWDQTNQQIEISYTGPTAFYSGWDAEADSGSYTRVGSAHTVVYAGGSNITTSYGFVAGSPPTHTITFALNSVVSGLTSLSAGTLTSTGTISAASTITAANVTTLSSSAIEINTGGTGNRYAYIDFHGDDTYTDYGLRIIRNNTGENTDSQIIHRGTGDLDIACTDGGRVHFPSGTVAIGTALGNPGVLELWNDDRGNDTDSTNKLLFMMDVSGGNSRSIVGEINVKQYNPSGHNSMDFRVGDWNNNSDSGSPQLTITSQSRVGINDQTPSYSLDVSGTGRFTGATYFQGDISLNYVGSSIHIGSGSNNGPHGLYFYDTDGTVGIQQVYRTTPESLEWEDSAGANLMTLDKSGNLRAVGEIESFDTSDIRLKKNVEIIEHGRSCQLLDVKTIEYDHILKNKHEIGLIAQDIQKIFPESVKPNKGGYLMIQYSKLTVPMLQIIQGQERRINELEKKLDDKWRML